MIVLISVFVFMMIMIVVLMMMTAREGRRALRNHKQLVVINGGADHRKQAFLIIGAIDEYQIGIRQ